MALDVGDARIGVALCDPLGIVVTPHGVVARRPEAAALAAIAALVASELVEGVVVGLPLSLNGEFSDQTRSVADFAGRLKAAVTVPVRLWDERYTTVEAGRIMRELGYTSRGRASGGKRGRGAPAIDAVAATVILQDYLDAHPRRATEFSLPNEDE